LKPRSKPYHVGRSVHSKGLGAFPIADAPAEDVLDPRRHLPLGDLALDDTDGVGLTQYSKAGWTRSWMG
jgi:hypothetical protein